KNDPDSRPLEIILFSRFPIIFLPLSSFSGHNFTDKQVHPPTMASSLIASQSLPLRRPLLPPNLRRPPPSPLLLPLSTVKSPNLGLRVLASSSLSSYSPKLSRQLQEIPISPLLTGPTRILATLLSVSLAFSTVIVKLVQNVWPILIPQCLINNPCSGLGALQPAGSLFFASLRNPSVGGLNTPLTVVAVGLAKWLDIYSGILMVRVLLSWFPNIPWERQPLSAIRDLCDPYLNLFRNIIPPVFDTLDVSPLLAFAVLGTLGSILSNTTRL
uniref:YlmG homolog protein 1-2, chloroplastic-like n=3 Tax=Cucumis melo TaxID=3656 RepID=A0A9I9DS74_CUCME